MRAKRRRDEETERRSAHAMTRLSLRGLVSVAAISVCTVWALLPLPKAVEESVQIPVSPQTTGETAPLDLAAFSSPIWYAPPAEAVVEQAKPELPPPPFDLQLIAIVDVAGRLGAIFYDPALDALVQVEPGQAIGQGRVVSAVEAASVLIDDHGRSRTIALDGARP